MPLGTAPQPSSWINSTSKNDTGNCLRRVIWPGPLASVRDLAGPPSKSYCLSLLKTIIPDSPFGLSCPTSQKSNPSLLYLIEKEKSKHSRATQSVLILFLLWSLPHPRWVSYHAIRTPKKAEKLGKTPHTAGERDTIYKPAQTKSKPMAAL